MNKRSRKIKALFKRLRHIHNPNQFTHYNTLWRLSHQQCIERLHKLNVNTQHLYWLQ